MMLVIGGAILVLSLFLLLMLLLQNDEDSCRNENCQSRDRQPLKRARVLFGGTVLHDLATQFLLENDT